jgi:hypothetical protein
MRETNFSNRDGAPPGVAASCEISNRRGMAGRQGRGLVPPRLKHPQRGGVVIEQPQGAADRLARQPVPRLILLKGARPATDRFPGLNLAEPQFYDPIRERPPFALTRPAD